MSLAFPWARALAVSVAVAALFALLAPAQAGVLAVIGATAACAHAAAHRRLAAIEDAACLAFLWAMFGLAGAGGFALVALAALAPVSALTRRWRSVTALIAATGAGAVLAAISGAGMFLPERWAAYAPLAPALFLALPARALSQLAAGAHGATQCALARLNGLGPLLVALVAGAGLGGLPGAAIGWAIVRLALPVVLLMMAPRRAGLAGVGIGVLAAGFVAAAAAGLALQYAGPHPAALAAAAVIALCVYGVGLRIHAPAAAARIASVSARLRAPPHPATSGPSRKYA